MQEERQSIEQHKQMYNWSKINWLKKMVKDATIKSFTKINKNNYKIEFYS